MEGGGVRVLNCVSVLPEDCSVWHKSECVMRGWDDV